MSNLPTVTNFSPVLDVPDTAPKLPVWATNENASYDDALPSRFFSLEGLTEWCNERNAESRILTVNGVSCELLYDPEREKPENGEWKPCLSFAETDTMLVVNKSRGQLLKQLTGSPLLSAWAKAGQVAIKPGITNGKAQIVVTRVPGAEPAKSKMPVDESYSTEDANDDLF